MPLKLMYITNDPSVAKIAESAGVDRIFVDMEYIMKQIPAVTQANQQMEALSKQWQEAVEAKANEAKALYEAFIQAVEALGVPTASGIFQADMQVSILNDGPVTLIVETPPRQKKLAKGTMSHLNLPPKEQEKFDEEAALVRRNLQLRKQQKG